MLRGEMLPTFHELYDKLVNVDETSQIEAKAFDTRRLLRITFVLNTIRIDSPVQPPSVTRSRRSRRRSCCRR